MFKIEMHAHTFPGSSDSQLYGWELVAAVKKKGLDGVVVTNHYDTYQINRFNGSCVKENIGYWREDIARTKEAGIKEDIRVYSGIEYTVSNKLHLSILGINDGMELPMPEMPYDEVMEFAEKFDLLVINNHPVRGAVCNRSEIMIDHRLGYELYNTKDGSEMWKDSYSVLRYTEWMNPVYIVGGDVHIAGHLGLGWMEFPTLPADERDMVRMLRNGECQIGLKRLKDVGEL